MADKYILQLEFELPNKEVAKAYYASLIDVDYEQLADTGTSWGPAAGQMPYIGMATPNVVSIYPKR